MSGALAARSADHEAEKGRVERTKVHRYWAGKAPEWAQAQEEEPAPLERVRTEVAVPVIVKRADDPRLRRLAGVSREDKEQAIAERRQIRAAEIVRRNREQSEEPSSAPDDENDEDQQRNGPVRRPGRRHESSEEPASEEPDEGPRRRGSAVAERDQQGVDDEEDEEALLRRRQAVKERLLQQQREEEERRRQAQAQQEEEEEEDEEEGSSEYETDTDDDDMPGGRMLKPVFVPKSARDTVAEREALEAEEEAERERERKRMEDRKHVTKAILKESIAQEAAQAAAAALGPALGADDIDTDTDDEEALEAYESWKRRELLRIKRDRDAREAREAERLERERLKSMTEEERAAWEKANPKEVKVKQKSKWKFMQKYWHKGAFFQETADDRFGTAGTDGIFQRDYSAPTGEDLFNRELMPKVMQVKNFGRSGRTKYTHLLDQDTTAAVSRDDLYEQVKDVRRKRTDAPVTAEAFAKPKKFKR